MDWQFNVLRETQKIIDRYHPQQAIIDRSATTVMDIRPVSFKVQLLKAFLSGTEGKIVIDCLRSITE